MKCWRLKKNKESVMFLFSYHSVNIERHIFMRTYTYCETNQFERQFQTMLYYRKSQDEIAMSKNWWLWCPCMYLLFSDPIFFFKLWPPCKVCNKKSVLYIIIIVHIPIQNFTCIITFIICTSSEIICILYFYITYSFIVTIFTCNELMSKVHTICLYFINTHGC